MALRLAATVHGPEKPDPLLGLAWFIEKDSLGWRRIYHSGAATGYWSFVGFSPEADVAVVVLVNSRDPSAGVLGRNLLAALTRASRAPQFRGEPSSPRRRSSSRAAVG